MSWAITMIYINITNFVLISSPEKDRNMNKTRRLKNAVVFFQRIKGITFNKFNQ